MHIRHTTAGLLLVLAGLTTAQGAPRIWLKEVPQTNPALTAWRVTAVETSADDWDITTYLLGFNDFNVYVDSNSGPRSCFQSHTADCLDGNAPPGITECTTNQSAADMAMGLVGFGVYTRKSEKPTTWLYRCRTRVDGRIGGRGLKYAGIVVFTPAPVSCISADALITIRGRVGERAKATTNLSIQCDSPATVRLTLSDGGLVSLGGDGQVRLLFGKNGRDVLDVSGTAPLVEIEGELIKSPTTAGTYRGSSVLRLDLL